MLRRLLLPLSLTGLAACSQQNPDADVVETGSLEPAEPVAAHSAELSWIAERGVRMFQLDRAAALATDAVLTAQGDEHPGAVVRGWIVVPDEAGFLVRFLAEREDGSLGSLFDVQIGESEPVVQLNRSLLDLSAEESALALANRSAPAAAERVCSDRYNTITLRDEPSGEIHVYLVPATVEPGVVFIAGFDRVRFSADGSEVLAYEPLSESCLAANITPDAAALAVALPSAELPDETHVFNSMNSNEIIAVVTRIGVWIVVGDTITYRARDSAE